VRSTRAARSWTAVSRRSYSTAIGSLDYEGIRGIGTGQLNFSGGITAIVGANGVGKSTILAAIYAAIAGEAPDDALAMRQKILPCSLGAHLSHDGAAFDRTVTYDAGGTPTASDARPIPLTILNPGWQAARIIELCSRISDLQTLLEAYPSRVFDSTELEHASYVANKDYEFIQVYEIDDFFTPAPEGSADEGDERELEPFPYFVVRSGGAEYGTVSMGLGEMAIHLAVWHFARVPLGGSILLLEEPETFIAPTSQSRMMDALAEASAERGVWSIVTTHSPAVLSRIPRADIRLVSRLGADLVIRPGPTDSELGMTLGAIPRKVGAILVEDRFAREFTSAWLRTVAPEIIADYEVHDVGGFSSIEGALETTPALGSWFSLVGLYDGDQRLLQQPRRWPHSFLIGDEAPELLFIDEAQTLAPAVATQLNRNVDEFRTFLAGLAGADPHDWFEELYRLLGVSYENLMLAFFSAWYADATNQETSNAALSDLRIALEAARTRPLPGE
jgi:hypothetical protein